MKKTLLIALLAAGLPLAASADDTASAPGADIQDSLAPASCKQPLLPSAVRRADDTSEFDAKLELYKTCVNKYISDQNELAKRHIAAGNAAAGAFNEFAKKLNAYYERKSEQ
jgi:hypothetical protein